MNKKAFTLAEVLLVITIVGIISSLTIPTIMKSYQKTQTINGYKTSYNIISQATKLIMANNDGTLVGAWGAFDDHESMYNAYAPYLKVAKVCANQAPLTSGCFATSYKLFNGSPEYWFGELVTTSVVLNNGASLAFANFSGSDAGAVNSIVLDINGPKGPNVTGKDFFEIIVYTNSDPVKPAADVSSWDEESIEMECPAGLDSGYGATCGIRILRGDYGTGN